MSKIEEKFPGDEHRQIYYMWREYPLGSKLTFFCGLLVGCCIGLVAFAWAVIQ